MPIIRTDQEGNTTIYSLEEGAIQEILYMRRN
jgi:hypothetical protein